MIAYRCTLKVRWASITCFYKSLFGVSLHRVGATISFAVPIRGTQLRNYMLQYHVITLEKVFATVDWIEHYFVFLCVALWRQGKPRSGKKNRSKNGVEANNAFANPCAMETNTAAPIRVGLRNGLRFGGNITMIEGQTAELQDPHKSGLCKREQLKKELFTRLWMCAWYQ